MLEQGRVGGVGGGGFSVISDYQHVIQTGCVSKHGLNNKQMVVTRYSKAPVQTTKGPENQMIGY